MFAAVMALGAIALPAFPAGAAAIWTEIRLHAFCVLAGCKGVGNPVAGLVADAGGNLYGTTSAGSEANQAVVFELSYDTAGSDWKYRVLHSFCSGSGCPGGVTPMAGLTLDSAGNLYGTTYNGGAAGQGTVFELSRGRTTDSWRYDALYSFCSRPGCADGANPLAGLIMDGEGNLFGTTYGGGVHDQGGTVFELSRGAASADWKYQVIHSFCAQNGCTDGEGPAAGLIIDGSGGLYGTTVYGGAAAGSGYGVVFELRPDPAGGRWAETVLYRFCALSGCADGANPYAGVIADAAGNLYGTTSAGGAENDGTVFALGSGIARERTFTVLHSFCSVQLTATCPAAGDGADPQAGLIMDPAGNLYGTTQLGGAFDHGAAFELRLDPAESEWVETNLHSFCARVGCADGANPMAGLAIDAAGNLYGTTVDGGTGLSGTAFELVRPR